MVMEEEVYTEEEEEVRLLEEDLDPQDTQDTRASLPTTMEEEVEEEEVSPQGTQRVWEEVEEGSNTPLRAAPQTTTATTTTRTTTRHQEPCCELQPGPNPWRSARGARREGSVWSLKQRESSTPRSSWIR